MKRFAIRLLPVFLATVCLVAALASEDEKKPKVGDKALPFETKTIHGDNFKLKDLKGKLVLIDFWGIWCPHCVVEIPDLKKAYEKYNKKGFEIISISFEDAAKLKPYVKEKEMNWHHISDPDKKIITKYNVKYWPSPFLVGPDGVVIAKDAPLRGDNLMATIEKHIDKVKLDKDESAE